MVVDERDAPYALSVDTVTTQDQDMSHGYTTDR